MVTSTIGQGRVVSIDSAKVARAPGILLVMTHENAPKQAAFEPHGADRHARPKPQLVDDRIAYWGQPVALVVGETFEAAQAGARSLTVAYETAPGKYDFEAGRSAAYQPKSLNGGANPDSKVGNFDTRPQTFAFFQKGWLNTGTKRRGPASAGPHQVIVPSCER